LSPKKKKKVKEGYPFFLVHKDAAVPIVQIRSPPAITSRKKKKGKTARCTVSLRKKRGEKKQGGESWGCELGNSRGSGSTEPGVKKKGAETLSSFSREGGGAKARRTLRGATTFGGR